MYISRHSGLTILYQVVVIEHEVLTRLSSMNKIEKKTSEWTSSLAKGYNPFYLSTSEDAEWDDIIISFFPLCKYLLLC
jgi:hypothetical protein